jgi:stearoyl-CoA desaturase (delta-9 desaturase)
VTLRVSLIAVTVWAVDMYLLVIYLHRCLSHNAFRMRRPLDVATRVLCMLRFNFDRREWAGVHRLHHRYATTPRDPHPVEELSFARALTTSEYVYIREAHRPETWSHLVRDIPVTWTDRLHDLYRPAGLLVVTAAGCALFGVETFLCAALIEQLMIHGTFAMLVALTHKIGKQPRPVPGRDSHLLSIVLWGEGYHNNHHFRPRSPDTARGIRGLDIGYIAIRILVGLRLADFNR